MPCSAKADEGNDGSASSLYQVTKHTFACSLKHVLVSNKKRI